jgi:hypothetical protein
MKKKAAKTAKHRGLSGQMSGGQKSARMDVNELAHHLGRISTESNEPGVTSPPISPEISRYMAALGSKGGKVGGKKRSAGMSPERRREIALKAARSRWDKSN